MATSRKLAPRILAVPAVGAMILAGCSDDGNDDPATTDGGATGEAAAGEEVELSFAHSYSTEHPHHACGAQVVADELADGDSGIRMEIFPSSQLGPDGPDRVSAVASGDISVDIQGSSAISALYEPIGALDAAYAIDGADHLFEFADSEAFDEMSADMLEAIDVRVLDVWYFGMRHFSANDPIRSPEDLEGLRMRFPDSPQYLQNAEAVGAQATPVAFEEVYLSLQQGVIDGQENPIPTISDMNFDEVQEYVSMSGHQAGFQVAIIGESTWQSLSADQQEALQSAISGVREENRQCIEDAEQEVIGGWEQAGTPQVVDDVDREAFSDQAESYFLEELTGDKLALYEQVREVAP